MKVCVDDEVRLTKSSNRDGLGVDGLSNKSREDEGNGELEHVCLSIKLSDEEVEPPSPSFIPCEQVKIYSGVIIICQESQDSELHCESCGCDGEVLSPKSGLKR